MVRASKLLLALVVLLPSAFIGLAYTGTIESLVAPDQLPGSPVVGGVAIVVLFVLGILVSSHLDNRAWKAMGSQAGLTTDSSTQFPGGPPDERDKPTLTGIVDGRHVRAWTYSTSGSRNSNSKTYTVVEAELASPVPWHASFGAEGTDQVPDDADMDAMHTRTVNGLGVRGDVSEDLARAIVTRDVRDAVTTVSGEVSVGSVKENVIGDMMDHVEDEAGGVAGALAKQVLKGAGGGEDGPSRTVEYRDRGLLTDGSTLQHRVDVVTTVADAVDQASASAGDPTASPE